MIRRLNDSIGFLASLASVIGFTTGVQSLPSILGYTDPGIAPILSQKGFSDMTIFSLALTCVSLLFALHMLMVQLLAQLLAKSGFLLSSEGSIIKAGEGSRARRISIMFFLIAALFGFSLSLYIVEGIQPKYLQDGTTVYWILGITAFFTTLSATRVNGPELTRIQKGVVHLDGIWKHEVFYPIPYKSNPHLTLHGAIVVRPSQQRPDGFRFQVDQGTHNIPIHWTADGILDLDAQPKTTRTDVEPESDRDDENEV